MPNLGILGDRLIVAIVGRLQAWKGPHRVIEAVSTLRGRGANVHLLVRHFGAAGQRRALERFSAAAITQRLGKALEAMADDGIVGRCGAARRADSARVVDAIQARAVRYAPRLSDAPCRS
jgi:hypothetical protein